MGDKCVRIFDPRKPDDAMGVVGAFGGIKATKCFFVNAYGWVGSTGFSKSAKRELKMWDLRNDDKICHYLSLYRDGVPQKGGGWVYKRGLSVMKCEVQRFLKLTKDSVVPISFIVPRKSGGDVFQEDIYPNCRSAKPGLSADEWSSGNNADPNTMSMDPEERKDDGGADDVAFNKKATYDEVVAENMELKKKVKLQDEIALLKGGGGGDDDENKEDDADYNDQQEQGGDD